MEQPWQVTGRWVLYAVPLLALAGVGAAIVFQSRNRTSAIELLELSAAVVAAVTMTLAVLWRRAFKGRRRPPAPVAVAPRPGQDLPARFGRAETPLRQGPLGGTRISVERWEPSVALRLRQDSTPGARRY